MFTLLLLLFVTSILSIDTGKPELRLLFLLIIPVMIYFKAKIDKRLFDLSLSKKALTTLGVIAALLIGLRLAHTTYRLSKTSFNMEDIAHVHLRAIPLLFIEHKNPYTEPIDHYAVGSVDYHGLKYPPLGVIFYAPFVGLFKEKGIYVANAALYFFVAFLIFYYLNRYTHFHAYLGLIFFLGSDFYFRLALNRGTNDFLPMIFLLSMVLVLRGKSNSSEKFEKFDMMGGVFLGLSLLAKQFPGGLFFGILLLQKRWKVILVGTLLFLLGIFPFILWDRDALYQNMFYFNLIRPVRPSSILEYFSPFWQSLTPLIGLVSISLLSLIGNWKKFLNLTSSWFFPFIALLIFILSSKMSPYHYFVWALPFMIFYYLTPASE